MGTADRSCSVVGVVQYSALVRGLVVACPRPLHPAAALAVKAERIARLVKRPTVSIGRHGFISSQPNHHLDRRLQYITPSQRQALRGIRALGPERQRGG